MITLKKTQGDKMTKYHIEIVLDECISCSACEANCPDSYEMKEQDDGSMKAVAKNPDVDDLGCAQEAAEMCPVNCIHITDESGGKIV